MQCSSLLFFFSFFFVECFQLSGRLYGEWHGGAIFAKIMCHTLTSSLAYINVTSSPSSKKKRKERYKNCVKNCKMFRKNVLFVVTAL